MKTQKLDIKTTDGQCDSFVAYPDDGGSYPVILYYADAFGLRDYVFEMCEKIASHGYFVLAPNFFYRQKRAPLISQRFPLTIETRTESFKELMPLIQAFDPAQAMSDVKTYFDFFAQQKQAKPGPIGTTGYCMGGALALRTAAHYPDKVAAVASYHAGRLANDQPNSVHKIVKNIKARIYVAHADHDESMPQEMIEKFEAALKEAHLDFRSETYKGATHGFTQKDLPAYNAEALARHWKSLLLLFNSAFKKTSV